jgi:CubicO group peptidase (beta-lactamase class C family)
MNPPPATEPLAAAFRANFEDALETGAACCLWSDAGPALSLAGGHADRPPGRQAWTRDTLVPVWSATKGPAAAALLHALALNRLDPGLPVERFWPALGPRLTLAEILSHQAGLAAIDQAADAFDHQAVVAALETQLPAWQPPGHGYHPRTFGYLVDELVRRITGAPSLGAYWREAIARPHDLDIWIGLPPTEDHRVAELIAPRPEPPASEAAFYAALATPGSLSQRAFASPRGLAGVAEMRRPETWRAGLAGFGGLASAEGLAKFYFLLATGTLPGGPRGGWLRERRADGPDQVLLLHTAFSCGFMLAPLSAPAGPAAGLFGTSPDAFGHPGAGGSHAFGDPRRRLGFAYVMNRMALGILPGPRARRLVSTLALA